MKKNIIDALQRRYATKIFDKNKKISKDDWNTICEALRLSPSSNGLQPWRFIHVTDPEVRAKLMEHSHGQSKVTDASDLFVIATKTNLQERDIENYVQDMAETRKVAMDILEEFKKMLMERISGKTSEEIQIWNQKQAYIAVGVAITVCAMMKIDACPMEGFVPSKYDEILGLKKMGLTATVVIAMGYRSEEDTYAHLEKVRFPKERLFIER